MRILISAAVTLLLHIVVGWQWGIIGALTSGFLANDRGWLAGCLAMVLAWILLLAWTYLSAPGETMTMISALSNIMGNLPTAIIPLITLMIPVVLGTLGGLLGSIVKGNQNFRR